MRTQLILILILLRPLAAKCTGPPNPGGCQGVQNRYYFNQTTNNCTQFTWGGCGGNLQNNFETYEVCMQQCNNETREYRLRPACLDENDARRNMDYAEGRSTGMVFSRKKAFQFDFSPESV